MWYGAMAALRQMVQSFVGDRALGVKVVYRRVTGMSFEAESQTISPTYLTTSVRAIIGQLSNKDRGSAQTSLGEATRKFTIAQGDLGGKPRPGDLIEVGSDTYRVGTTLEDRVGARYRIEAERL